MDFWHLFGCDDKNQQGMRKYFNTFWVIFTVILSVTFVVLFSFVLAEGLGIAKIVIYNLIGLIVIWIVYFIRAYIFTKYFSENDATKP